MNKLAVALLWAALGLGSLDSFGADEAKTNSIIEIKAGAAKENVGKHASVSGTVAEVSKASGLVRLNFEKPFPHQPFTAVIFAHNTNGFGNLDALKGQKVEITGKISEYRSRPQIILTSTNQLKIIPSESEQK